MRSLISIMIFLLLICSQVYGERVALGKLQATKFVDNGFAEVEMRGYFDTGKYSEGLHLLWIDYIYAYHVTFGQKQLPDLKAALEKYVEWEKLAVEKQVKIKKAIAKVGFGKTVEVKLKSKERWNGVVSKDKAMLLFASLSTDEHVLAVKWPTWYVHNMSNPVPSVLMFNKEQVEQLRDWASGNVEELLEEKKKQEEVEAMFK